MPMSRQAFEAILTDDTKEIAHDFAWRYNENDSPSRHRFQP